MGYSKWFDQHAKKQQAIVKKLLKLNKSTEEIVDYFEFEHMCAHEQSFCPLYKKKQKCHDIEELNCYLCACPYFRFDDEGITQREGKILYSICTKNLGRSIEHANALHHDCSECTIPHHRSFILENIANGDWLEIMAKCKNQKTS